MMLEVPALMMILTALCLNTLLLKVSLDPTIFLMFSSCLWRVLDTLID